MNIFLKKIKLLKFKDIYQGIVFVVALPCSFLFKKKHKNLWLICESEFEARDNGYWLFRYIREKHSEIDCYYAINNKSVDYSKVKCLGNVISYGTFTHWLYYLSAQKNISTQKGGKPNAAICYFLEIYGILKNKRIFLQHGITISKATWLFYENTKMRLFICGAKPEYNEIVNNFHYPKNYVKYTGFSRFDTLHDFEVKQNQVLVMPSWREWLNSNTEARKTLKYDGIFTHSKYYLYWEEFLCSSKLKEILETYNLELIFYPHRNMQQYLDKFHFDSKRILMGNWEKYDVQTLLKESALLITDYSSVFMDFSYMYKPVQFYQFDEDEFREGQYEEGYFSYEKDGFGKVSYSLEELLVEFERLCKNNLNLDKVYEEKINNFFELNDRNNCKRNYEAILGLNEE